MKHQTLIKLMVAGYLLLVGAVTVVGLADSMGKINFSTIGRKAL